MTDLVIILIIVAILAAALWKIKSDKKKGNKCAGCPYSNPENNHCR